MEQSCQTSHPVSVAQQRWYIVGYIAFTAIGIAHFIARNTSDALMYLGLALVFDPFNPNVSFSRRPIWQRVWLVVHVLATFALLGFTIGGAIKR